jgi:hypothetical protein
VAVGARLTQIFDLADAQGLPTNVAAQRMAEQRIAAVGRLRSIWVTERGAPRRPWVGCAT